MKTENTKTNISPSEEDLYRDFVIKALKEEWAGDNENADEEIKIVKNGNPELAVAKWLGHSLGLMPITGFLVVRGIFHPISSHSLVYKDAIVIDATTELWYGKGLCGEGVDSLAETLKGLPEQKVGVLLTVNGDVEALPLYFEMTGQEMLEDYLATCREKRNEN